MDDGIVPHLEEKAETWIRVRGKGEGVKGVRE